MDPENLIADFVTSLRALFNTRYQADARESSELLSEKIGAALQPFLDTHALAGAVTVVGDLDKILSFKAVGFADVAAQRPMARDTLFWIASLSKPITAAALMILADAGKLKVNDPVEKYLPEFKDVRVRGSVGQETLHSPRRSITIRHLLCHTSGLPFSSSVEQPTLDLIPLRDRVRSYAMTPLLFQPGSRFHYSNAGINTVGRIIEVVSQMPYEKFLAQHLLQPLEMKDTTFRPNKNQLSRLAKAYEPNPDTGELQETQSMELWYPLDDGRRQVVPAGGLFSTGEDLAHFCHMILNGGMYKGKRYLSSNAVKQMMRKQTGIRVQESMSLGWETNGYAVTHGGSFKVRMTIDWVRWLFTIFLVQHKEFAANGAQSHQEFLKAAGMEDYHFKLLWKRDLNHFTRRLGQRYGVLPLRWINFIKNGGKG
jgi:CubicO group peptidase (beta-lactamase class C family)